jgi:hypothetical protein
MIALINGPWDGRSIEDSGSAIIRMGIYESGMPIIGEHEGQAIYEPANDRTKAFWSHNDWLGIVEEIIPWV